ncbi:histone H3.v1 [Arachis ipaensis]|uniref:histone H3.v1 n=1 Tax=Arachis ipaensis TaxID=130454 RepID=UPI0007AF4A3E|nr:histone H3.v1 [Arachis ipaensis]
MQAVSVIPFPNLSAKFENDFAAKLRIYDDEKPKTEVLEQEQEQVNEEQEQEEEQEEEEEFSFVFSNPEVSPVSADDVFDNGQIRPVYPIFDQNLLFSDEYAGGAELRPPLKKVFMEQQQRDEASSSSAVSTAAATEGPYCEWSPKMAGKSNSTGFSKLWKLRDHKLRSNSDGKDAFVFLSPPSTAKTEKAGSGNGAVKKAVKVTKGKTTSSSSSSSSSSAHEKHYVMNRARKESGKRRSYLPYRQELFGFFSSTTALSRNVHPY